MAHIGRVSCTVLCPPPWREAEGKSDTWFGERGRPRINWLTSATRHERIKSQESTHLLKLVNLCS